MRSRANASCARRPTAATCAPAPSASSTAIAPTPPVAPKINAVWPFAQPAETEPRPGCSQSRQRERSRVARSEQGGLERKVACLDDDVPGRGAAAVPVDDAVHVVTDREAHGSPPERDQAQCSHLVGHRDPSRWEDLVPQIYSIAETGKDDEDRRHRP